MALKTARLWTGLAMLIVLAGCAMQRPPTAPVAHIGPYPAFSGRLIVMQPTRRWQVQIDWKSSTPAAGWLRLTHAASGRIIVLTWRGSTLHLSDNRDPAHPDRLVSEAKLADYGIVLPPRELAAILLDRMPARFHPTGPDRWEARRHGDVIRIAWYPEARRLTLTDVTRGNRATLLIGTS